MLSSRTQVIIRDFIFTEKICGLLLLLPAATLSGAFSALSGVFGEASPR